MTAPVPSTLDELLSPDWLTTALGARFPGITVTAVTPGAVISRVATNARFRIECAGGVPAGLSPDLCGKGYFTEAGRAFRRAGIPEACFYRDVAARSGVRTLRSVYADVDPGTKQGVVITEDVIVEGAEFLDARSDYTPDQAAESLAQLATLHASTWGATDLAATRWLTPRLGSYLELRGVKDILVNFDGPIGAGVPEPVRDAERLVRAYRSLAALTARDDAPWCVIHGDAHVGNVFVDSVGRPSFLDWQLVQRGPWYLDVGYHLASALSVEDRRRTERDLVAHYLDRLRAAGIETPSEGAVWQGIRRGVVHGLYLWAITLKVDPAVTSVLLTRLGTAAADHDALTALDR